MRNKWFEMAYERDPDAASLALMDAVGHYLMNRSIGGLKDLKFDNLIDAGDALLICRKHVTKLTEKQAG
jgi:hypothetical protein